MLFAAPLAVRAATTPPPLATARSFAILAGSAVTNTGPSAITGDLGLSPGSSVTGFPPGTVNGSIHVDDAVSVQAQSDLVTAYDSAASQPCASTLTGDLGGRTLTPGVYCFTSSAQLTGTLTVDGGGDPNAVFIFKIASALTTASSSRVDLVNGGPCGIFWQVGSSATLGTDTNFVGTLLVNTSITLNTRANILPGRALAATGAVTLDSNTITRPPDTCTVATSSTTTSLNSSPNPSLPGAPVVLGATVTSNIPGIAPPGTVIFKEGSTTLGQAPLDSSGNATLTLPALSAGTHVITATYLGAPRYLPSTSSLVQTVTFPPSAVRSPAIPSGPPVAPALPPVTAAGPPAVSAQPPVPQTGAQGAAPGMGIGVSLVGMALLFLSAPRLLRRSPATPNAGDDRCHRIDDRCPQVGDIPI